MKIAVGMLHQETDSFNAKMTRLADLDVSRGLEVLARWRGTGMCLGGALEVLEETGAEIVPLMAAVLPKTVAYRIDKRYSAGIPGSTANEVQDVERHGSALANR